MRNLIVLFILVSLLLITSCMDGNVNGQESNRASNSLLQNINTTNSNVGANPYANVMPGNAMVNVPVNQPTDNTEETSSKKSAAMPYTGVIKIESPPAYNSREIDVIRKWKEILRWGDFCSDERVAGINIYKLDSKRSLIAIYCTEGAYNFNSLFYSSIKSKNGFTAQLMRFEYFRRADESSRMVRHLTSVPNGAIGFNEKEQKISNYHRYAGAGQCGWEAIYRIANGKAVLKSMKARWDCEPNMDGSDPIWTPLNLNKLRKAAKKTVYDKLD